MNGCCVISFSKTLHKWQPEKIKAADNQTEKKKMLKDFCATHMWKRASFKEDIIGCVVKIKLLHDYSAKSTQWQTTHKKDRLPCRLPTQNHKKSLHCPPFFHWFKNLGRCFTPENCDTLFRIRRTIARHQQSILAQYLVIFKYYKIPNGFFLNTNTNS